MGAAHRAVPVETGHALFVTNRVNSDGDQPVPRSLPLPQRPSQWTLRRAMRGGIMCWAVTRKEILEGLETPRGWVVCEDQVFAVWIGSSGFRQFLTECGPCQRLWRRLLRMLWSRGHQLLVLGYVCEPARGRA